MQSLGTVGRSLKAHSRLSFIYLCNTCISYGWVLKSMLGTGDATVNMQEPERAEERGVGDKASRWVCYNIPVKQLQGLPRGKITLSEVNLNLRYLGIKHNRVTEPGTTERKEQKCARTLTLVGKRVRQLSDPLFSFWQNEEGFVKCLEKKKEVFGLSPYKIFA